MSSFHRLAEYRWQFEMIKYIVIVRGRIDSVPWKWWAKYQKFDRQNAKVEVVDIMHFLVSIAQVLGMSADDIFDAYCKKNEVNHERQDSGYATKNKDDSRSI
jgi:dimeric dUTPase (all-alpha-NTP-PPase superfamily)